jgi:small-conductance mechanosensitive channel
MADIPAWYWQVLGAIFGLGLGVLIGALRRKNKVVRPKQREPQAGRPSQLSRDAQEPAGPASQFHAPSGFRQDAPPQQRLMERLRENNLELAAQVKALTDLRDQAKAQGQSRAQGELEALKVQYERQLEELRQAHSSELAHLMSVLVEQVDGIHKTHANHVRALEAEIERARGQGDSASRAPSTMASTEFANTSVQSQMPRH